MTNLAATLTLLAGCGGSPAGTSANCFDRYDRLIPFPDIQRRIGVQYVFDMSSLPEPRRRALIERGFGREPPSMTYVVGDPKDAITRWSQQKVGASGAVLIAGKSVLASTAEIASSRDEAIRRGCAMENEHGRLRSVHLSLPAD